MTMPLYALSHHGGGAAAGLQQVPGAFVLADATWQVPIVWHIGGDGELPECELPECGAPKSRRPFLLRCPLECPPSLRRTPLVQSQ